MLKVALEAEYWEVAYLGVFLKDNLELARLAALEELMLAYPWQEA